MKKIIRLLIVALAIVMLASCSSQQMLSSQLKTEWNIEKFESRDADGGTTTIENAGSIIFRNDEEGIQSFNSAIIHGGAAAEQEFTWENTANTVTIKSKEVEAPKVWIVVNSKRTEQEWYSTDSQGNVQVMHLKKE